jgi:hypothetical protein
MDDKERLKILEQALSQMLKPLKGLPFPVIVLVRRTNNGRLAVDARVSSRPPASGALLGNNILDSLDEEII